MRGRNEEGFRVDCNAIGALLRQADNLEMALVISHTLHRLPSAVAFADCLLKFKFKVNVVTGVMSTLNSGIAQPGLGQRCQLAAADGVCALDGSCGGKGPAAAAMLPAHCGAGAGSAV